MKPPSAKQYYNPLVLNEWKEMNEDGASALNLLITLSLIMIRKPILPIFSHQDL